MYHILGVAQIKGRQRRWGDGDMMAASGGSDKRTYGGAAEKTRGF